MDSIAIDVSVVDNWDVVCRDWNRRSVRNTQYAIAMTSASETPDVLPLIAVILRPDMTGCFPVNDEIAGRMSSDGNIPVCVTATFAPRQTLQSMLMRQSHERINGFRLFGKLGKVRRASSEEKRAITRCFGLVRWTKGGRQIIAAMTQVQDIRFTKAEWIA